MKEKIDTNLPAQSWRCYQVFGREAILTLLLHLKPSNLCSDSDILDETIAN